MRRITLPTHALAEVVLGLALITCGFVLGLGGAGTVLTLLAGGLVAGIGLGFGEQLPLAAHQALDRGVVYALAGAAVVVAALGDAAALLLLGAAVAETALASATRWTRGTIAR
jgi:hypothetical protein